MYSKDICRRYLTNNGQVRVTVIIATSMVTDARNIHNLSNVATAALGRTMMVTTMMADMLKDTDNMLTVQIRGDGPLGNIIVCSNNSLNTKGYVQNPQVELELNKNGKLDVAKAVGKGSLNIVKDIGLKNPYIGYSELISSEIAQDFAYYFVTSEQTPSVVSLGVNISKQLEVEIAAGYIIQPLPECEEKVIDLIENINLNISSVTNLAMDLGDIDEIVKFITGDNNIKLISEKSPCYKCDCNYDRVDRTIIAIGKNEAIKIANENNGKIEVNCHFCNKTYEYDVERINGLFTK